MAMTTANKVETGEFGVNVQRKAEQQTKKHLAFLGTYATGKSWHGPCCRKKHNPLFKGDTPMKKMLSTIVAALVAVSFAGLVFAAEPAKTEAPAAAPAAGEVKKDEKKPAKKAKKAKKSKKATKKEEAPAAAPAAPAAPAAK